ncbi:MAG: hypothetical protein AB7I79_03725 [Rhizobiaceae bacterium]
MTPTAIALAVVAPLILAEDRPSAFDDIIGEMVISRAEATTEWPFSIDVGELSCITLQGQRQVFFAEILTSEEMGEIGNMTLPRMVVVTTNPFALFATIEDRELYAPYDSLEALITRLAPYETMGFAICPDEKDA